MWTSKEPDDFFYVATTDVKLYNTIVSVTATGCQGPIFVGRGLQGIIQKKILQNFWSCPQTYCATGLRKKSTARWRYRLPIKYLKSHYNTQSVSQSVSQSIKILKKLTGSPKTTLNVSKWGLNISPWWFIFIKSWSSFEPLYAGKLDGLGPIDKRPSTDTIGHITCDTLHVIT